MVVVGIAGLVVGVVSLLWMVNEWLNRKFEKLDKRLQKHDRADAKLKAKAKSGKKDLQRVEKKVDDGFEALNAKIDTLILNTSEKQAA